MDKYFCESQDLEAGVQLNYHLVELINKAMNAGLGSRYVGHILLREALQLSFHTCQSKTAVMHNLLLCMAIELERITPLSYIEDDWFDPKPSGFEIVKEAKKHKKSK